jgi:hypothetical protein
VIAWVVRRPLYISDYSRAFERAGVTVRMVDRAELRVLLTFDERPDFVLDSMLFGPHVDYVRAAGVTFVGLNTDQWYVTPSSLPRFRADLPGQMFVFCIGPEQVPYFHAAGYPHAEHMLFGVDAERFRPDSLAGAGVGFMGSPLRAHRPPLPEEERDRLAAVEALYAAFGDRFDLWGSADWREQLAGRPALAAYRGLADWGTDLPRVIVSTAVNVNVSKRRFPTGVCPRVFEIAACARPILSNRIPAVEAIFPDGVAALYFSTADELVGQARRLLASPALADRLGAAGRLIVTAGHTVYHRARRVLDAIGGA